MTTNYEKLAKSLTGVNVLLTTPFTEDGAIDEAALRAKVAHQIETGLTAETGALIAVGSVGESATLSAAEQERVVRTVVEEAGDVPIVAGANHSGTKEAATLARQAVDAGTDAVMSIPPYYYPPSSASVRAHLEGIAAEISGEGGIVIYNNMTVSGIDIPLETITALAQQPEFVAIKEPSLDTSKLDRIIASIGDKITVLNGNGDPLEPQCYLLGSQGFTSAWANAWPELSLKLHKLATEGQYGELLELRRQYITPVTELLTQVEPEHSPAFLKYLESAMGVPGGGPVRSPHPELPSDVKEELDRAIQPIKSL